MNINAIRAKLADIEELEDRLLDARQSLRALVDGFDPPIPPVPTGKRKPRPVAPARERRPRVAIVSVSAAYEAVLGGATTLDAVVAASRLSRPCARVALAQLVDEGRLRRSGATRAARWHLPTEVEPTGDNGEEDEG